MLKISFLSGVTGRKRFGHRRIILSKEDFLWFQDIGVECPRFAELWSHGDDRTPVWGDSEDLSSVKTTGLGHWCVWFCYGTPLR